MGLHSPAAPPLAAACAVTAPMLFSPATAVAAPDGTDPFADVVVAYTPGTNAAPGFTSPEAALGEPTRVSAPDIFPNAVTPFQPAFAPDEIVSIGTGGSLTLRFDTPVTDDPDNPFGIDLLVFGNALFPDAAYPTGIVGGLLSEGGVIEVSADGETFVPVPGVVADGLFPTVGYLDLGPYDDVPSRVPSDFTRPVDPALTLDDLLGLSHDEIMQLYDGSGGGTGIDLADVGLASISFVRISNPSGAMGSPEVDAIADVAPADSGPSSDLTGDGAVGVDDLLLLLQAWGAAASTEPADLNDDDLVDVADLLILLSEWSA